VNDPYQVRVAEVIKETADAHSIVFEIDAANKAAFSYTPGQFLTIAVPSTQTGVAARCYSLSSAPHESDLLKITVKRTVDGYASNWICDNVKAGQTLTVLPPSGIFTPKDLNADFLLFGGGSGVTPVISIAKSALSEGEGKVVLLYANRDEESIIFKDELNDLADKYADRFTVLHWLETVQGLPTADHMRAFAEHFLTFDAFVCGPGPFMSGVVSALKELGFPRERRHQEKFVSLGGNPFGEAFADVSAQVEADAAGDGPSRTEPAMLSGELDGVEFTFDDWPANKPMLDFLLEKGVEAPFSCREGNCSACACRLIEGEVDMIHNDVLDSDDLEEGIRLSCQSLPVTDSVKISFS
jgi:3-ketosteroid 9alpha-monooxygenase subunit B